MHLLPDAWTWDMWFVDDGRQFHAFYLKASRALIDPDRRHLRASVGHAVSDDLHTWTELADAFVPSDGPAFDDLAIWTGSVLRGPDGDWRFFYTGCSRARPEVQRISVARSRDLVHWTRDAGAPVLEADPTWYERLGDSAWDNETWRDPWVFPVGDEWHMLLTARARDGEPRGRGVVGHAVSTDLDHWEVRAPLSAPGTGFGQLEVLQLAEVEGRLVLLFSCLGAELSDGRRATDDSGGIWSLPVDSPTGPFDVGRATRLTDHRWYAGRLVEDRAGRWNLMAFRNEGDDGAFVGGIGDPVPVTWDGERLVLAGYDISSGTAPHARHRLTGE